ncbi:MAG: hypothetical protein U0838_07745 [Chloroflexota bacterium]
MRLGCRNGVGQGSGGLRLGGDGGQPLGDRIGGARLEVQRRAARQRRARLAPAIVHIPAVAARVLAAVEAEIEGLVEGVELQDGGLELLLAARVGHRLGEGVVGQDVVAEALGEGLRLADREVLGRAVSNV